MNRFATSELKNDDLKADLKTEISYLAHQYHSSYKPTSGSLKKHRFLKKLRNNKDKGNGVVILDKEKYNIRLVFIE